VPCSGALWSVIVVTGASGIFMHRLLVDPSEDSLFLVDIPLRVQIATIASFLFYVWNSLGLKVATAISSLSGVRHQFRANSSSLQNRGNFKTVDRVKFSTPFFPTSKP
jgi:hypothetical protein